MVNTTKAPLRNLSDFGISQRAAGAAAVAIWAIWATKFRRGPRQDIQETARSHRQLACGIAGVQELGCCKGILPSVVPREP